MWRHGKPSRSDRRSAIRRLRYVGHYEGTGPQLEALRVCRPGPRSRAGRRRHRDPRLQRDLGEDAGRSHLRRGPHDDVHGRLRGRRLGPAARPPVRGGVRLPGGRGRGRAGRAGLHVPTRATGRSPRRARSMASTTTARNASAGSRRRHHSRPLATPIAGSRAGRSTRRPGRPSAEEEADGAERSSSSAGRGRSVSSSPATTSGPGRTSSSPGATPTTSPRRWRSWVGGRSLGSRFDLAEPETIAAALADVGPVRRLALVAIERDQNTIADYDIAQAMRLVTLKLVGLHRGRASRCTTG